ncbi:MAG: TetR/AcrR family transcriptional regulator [Sneathiellales bacterium]|nr:TetR/AcrR family transcriptional regulator [Sneathiellales bacterium]
MAVEKLKLDRAGETRKRILDAAAKLFRESGYAAVSLRSIADAADMKAGSVYYHFKSKEEIVLEVLDLGIERVHSAVEGVFSARDSFYSVSALIEGAITAHLKTLLEHTDYTSANVRIYGQVPESIRIDALAVRRRYEALWDSILSYALDKQVLKPDVNPRLFRLMLIGTLNATLEWFDPEKGSVDDLARSYSAILLNGIVEE